MTSSAIDGWEAVKGALIGTPAWQVVEPVNHIVTMIKVCFSSPQSFVSTLRLTQASMRDNKNFIQLGAKCVMIYDKIREAMGNDDSLAYTAIYRLLRSAKRGSPYALLKISTTPGLPRISRRPQKPKSNKGSCGTFFVQTPMLKKIQGWHQRLDYILKEFDVSRTTPGVDDATDP